jgi:methionyl-tRNA formyltransferase
VKLVFVGCSHFGLRCLEACLKTSDVQVVGVVTSNQTFTISYCPAGVTNVLFADLATFAKSKQIPVQTLAKSMNDPALVEAVKVWQPDLFLVAGWYHMVPKSWRELAPAFGLHASLLPDYSGGAPLVWAMINGETKTGITLFQMDDGVDSGPIAGQKEELIWDNDTIASLYGRIEKSALELLHDTLPRLIDGTLKLRPQDDAKRRVMPQRSPDDGRIDWTQPAVVVDRFIRAQTRPYPGAFSFYRDRKLHIWSAKVIDLNIGSQPGHVFLSPLNRVCISCGIQAIEILDASFDSKDLTLSQIAALFRDTLQMIES